MDPEFARLAAPLVRFLEERKQRNYPDALTFGVTLPIWLAKETRERSTARDPSFTPATCVSDHMLDSDRLREAIGSPWYAPHSDFKFSIQYRAMHDESRLKALSDEVQAYADAVVLYVATTQWLMIGHPRNPLFEVVSEWPAFRALEDTTRSLVGRFVSAHENWARSAVHAQDMSDGRAFMQALVSHAGVPREPARLRGLRTARDTLSLHVDYLNAILGGDLSFGA